jgi:hypothetical protein
VSLALRGRLKNLKKQVLEQLGMDKMCGLRIYFYESFEASAADDDLKKEEEGEGLP